MLVSETALRVIWTLGDGSQLSLIANLATDASHATLNAPIEGDLLFSWPPDAHVAWHEGWLAPWCVLWFLSPRAS